MTRFDVLSPVFPSISGLTDLSALQTLKERKCPPQGVPSTHVCLNLIDTCMSVIDEILRNVTTCNSTNEVRCAHGLTAILRDANNQRTQQNEDIEVCQATVPEKDERDAFVFTLTPAYRMSKIQSVSLQKSQTVQKSCSTKETNHFCFAEEIHRAPSAKFKRRRTAVSSQGSGLQLDSSCGQLGTACKAVLRVFLGKDR